MSVDMDRSNIGTNSLDESSGVNLSEPININDWYIHKPIVYKDLDEDPETKGVEHDFLQKYALNMGFHGNYPFYYSVEKRKYC